MKLRILPSALKDLTRGRKFYERLDQDLGRHFLDSLFGDIDSLTHHAGSHRKVFGYHRLLAKRFPFAIYYFPFAIYYKKEGNTCLVWRVLDCRQNPATTSRALK